MPDKKDKKTKPKRVIKLDKEPKPAVIDPIEVPAVAFTERAKVKSLAKEPSKQADFKPDYLKEAQFAHQIHLKTLPDNKPSPADLVTKGLQYAGEVAQRLGKSAAKIEHAVEKAEAAPKKKPGRPKKQTTKDKEDERLAMEVKGTKDAVAAVAKELEKHEEMSEAEEAKPAKPAKTTKAPKEKKEPQKRGPKTPRFAAGTQEAKDHMAKVRAARKKKE